MARRGCGGAPGPLVRDDLRRPLWIAAALSAVLVVGLGAWFQGDFSSTRFDRWARDVLPDTMDHSSDARPWALGVDALGEPVGRTLGIVSLTVLCLTLGHRRLAVFALGATLVSTVAGVLLKYPVDRRINDGSLSYPSGHTAIVATMGFVLALLVITRWQPSTVTGATVLIGVTVIAGLVAALAQTSLDAHYATDTIAGIVLPLVVLPPTARVIDRVAAVRGTDLPTAPTHSAN